MKTAIEFCHMKSSEAVETAIRSKISDQISHICPEALYLHATVGVDRISYSLHCQVKLPQTTITLEGTGTNMYTLINELADRMVRQVRKYREKRRSQRHLKAVVPDVATVDEDFIDAEEVIKAESNRVVGSMS